MYFEGEKKESLTLLREQMQYYSHVSICHGTGELIGFVKDRRKGELGNSEPAEAIANLRTIPLFFPFQLWKRM